MNLSDEIVASYQAGTLHVLITRTARAHYGTEEGDTFRRKLIEKHNAGDINLMTVARSLPAGRSEGYDYWIVQDVYAKVIVDLQAEPDEMLAAVKTLNALGGTDLAAGRANHPFRDWMVRTGHARDMIALIDPESTDDIAAHALALEAIAQGDAAAGLDAAITLLHGEVQPPKLSGAVAVGHFDLSAEPALARRALAELSTVIDARPEDRLVALALNSAVQTYRRSATMLEDALLDLLVAAGAGGEAGPETIHRCATILFLDTDDLSPAVITALIAIAREVATEHKGTIREIDHAVGQLLRRGKLDAALDLLEPVLARDASDLDAMESTAYALLELDRSQLEKVVLRWLRSGSRDLGDATRAVVGQSHGDGPVTFDIDFSAENLEFDDAVFLARKAIGFLFMQPITAASILVSLLRTGPRDAVEAVAEHLFDPLLINFSGQVSEWLGKRADDTADAAAPHIATVLGRLEEYLNGLRAIGEVPELHPSERQRLIERHRQQRAMEVAMKDAEKKTILQLIAKRSVLLYGNRSISYFEGPDGIAHRNEMKLGQFTHSIEAPRLDVLEPFGLDFELRVFRAERMVR